MDRATVLSLLRRSKPELQRRFGSMARDQSRADSDADVLVAFDGPADSRRYFGLQFYLEDLLGCPVDLVTEQALRPQLKPFIERDAIHV